MGAGSIAGIHTGSRDQASTQARMTSGFTIDFAHFSKFVLNHKRPQSKKSSERRTKLKISYSLI